MAKSDAGAGAGAGVLSCEGPAALQSETSKSDKNGVHYPHVVGKGGTPDSVSVPELQSIRREPWNNFCRQYGNRP